MVGKLTSLILLPGHVLHYEALWLREIEGSALVVIETSSLIFSILCIGTCMGSKTEGTSRNF